MRCSLRWELFMVSMKTLDDEYAVFFARVNRDK